MRKRYIAWRTEALALLADVDAKIDALTKSAETAASRLEIAVKSADDGAANGLRVDSGLDDLQDGVRACVRIALERTYRSSVFVAKNFLERCLHLDDVIREAESALGADASAALTAELVLQMPSIPSLPFLNCSKLHLPPDRIGIVLRTQVQNIDVVALLQFGVRFIGGVGQTVPTRRSQVAASDPAVIPAVAEELDQMLSTRPPRSFTLPSTSFAGLASGPPTDVVGFAKGIAVIDTVPTLGAAPHPIRDASVDIDGFDACMFLDAGQVQSAIASRVAALGQALTADYRPASASLASLRFSAAAQTLFAAIGVHVTQQGGENPCEWELSGSLTVYASIRPQRLGAAHFGMQPQITGNSNVSTSFRWRQDYSPCQLFAFGPIIDVLLRLFGNFATDLSGQRVPGLDISLPNVSYMQLTVRDDGLLALLNVRGC